MCVCVAGRTPPSKRHSQQPNAAHAFPSINTDAVRREPGYRFVITPIIIITMIVITINTVVFSVAMHSADYADARCLSVK